MNLKSEGFTLMIKKGFSWSVILMMWNISVETAKSFKPF